MNYKLEGSVQGLGFRVRGCSEKFENGGDFGEINTIVAQMDASGYISRSRDPDICLSEYFLVEADLLLFFAGAPRAALHLSGSLFHDHLKAVGTTGSHWQCARPLIA